MDVWLITDDAHLADAVVAALARSPELRLHRGTATGGAGVVLLGADRLGDSPRCGAPVLLLAEFLDPATLRAAYRVGAVDCLLVPAELPALPAAIHQAVRPGGSGGQLYGIYSAKGGSGKTLLAALLSLALQVRMQQSTLLVDLNLQFGGMEALLDLRPERDLLHLLPVAHELVPEQVARVACQHPSGLAVLCSPADPARAATCDPAIMRQLLTTCRGFYDIVIVDLPSALDEVSLATLAACDRVLYIATPDALVVPSMQRALGHLTLTGTLAPERVSLVINRTSLRTDVRPADLGALTGLPVLGTVRADFRRLQPLLSGERDFLSPDAAGGPGRDIAELAAALVHQP